MGLRRGGTFTPPVQDFTPADLPGLYVWLDASDAGTLTIDSGTVSAWADRSGNARHASQGTTAIRPTLQAAGLNGLPTVRFDGVDDRMVLAGFTHLTTLTVAVVARPTNLSGFRALVGRTEDSPWRHNWVVGLDSAKHLLLYYNGSVYPRAGAADAVTVNTAYVFTSRLDSSPAAHLWQDGELQNLAVDTIAPSPANFGAGVLGASDGGTASFWAGDISEVVITSGALSDEDVAALNAYLLSKWGI
ncbi:MAG TPA: LamG-like jellyroll fold domain-containing protein [Trueperaceae bacterium]